MRNIAVEVCFASIGNTRNTFQKQFAIALYAEFHYFKYI